MLEKNNDSFVYDCDFDDSFSKSNNDSLSNDSCFDDSKFDNKLYKFEVNCNDKYEIHEYSYDPMLYHILNDNYTNTHDPNISINEEYYSKRFDYSEILNINLIKNNIK